MLKMPELIKLNDHGGNWDIYLNAIYNCFKNDFIDRELFFKGVKLGLKKHPKFKDKEATFWHLITEGKIENERIPDMRRCERIKWPRCVIENSEHDSIKIWKRKKNNDMRIYLCYGSWDYLVVLSDRKGYLLPWTAFVVKYSHTKKKLKREYFEFIKKAKTASL